MTTMGPLVHPVPRRKPHSCVTAYIVVESGKGWGRRSGVDVAAASALSRLRQPRCRGLLEELNDRLIPPGRLDGPDFPEGLFIPLTHVSELTETRRRNRQQKTSACFSLP